jgi:hypothetical membrane protein
MRLLAWCGITAPVIRLGLLFILGTLQPNYSQVRDFISELGAEGAPFANVMNYVGIALVGALLALFSIPLYRVTKPGWLVLGGAASMALSGLTFIVVGFFPCDPGCSVAAPSMTMRVHILAGFSAMGTQSLAAWLYGFGLIARSGSRQYAIASLALESVAIVALALLVGFGSHFQWPGLLQKIEQAATDLWALLSGLYCLTRLRMADN